MSQYENLIIKKLELQIRNSINDSGLSAGSVYWLLRSLMLEIEILYNTAAQNEQEMYLSQQQEKSSEASEEITQQPLKWDVIVNDVSESKDAGQD